MNIEHRLPIKLVSCAVLGALMTGVGASEDTDVIFDWNRILQENGPPAPPFLNLRLYAMLHVAMFDAINSVDGGYTPYRVEVPSSSGASAEAAAAQAAHDVLAAVLPDATETFDAALDESLADIPPGLREQGVEVGRQAAQAVLDWRQDDGYAEPNPEYVLPELPGLWQPTAPGQVAAFAGIGDIEPFALLTPTQHLPRRPPTLTSEEYTADFQEVKELGSATSATRTQEQTDIARRWAVLTTSTTFFAVWNNVARDVAVERDLSLVDTARVFALMNAAMHDGLQTSQTSKFVYGLWRPVTAIRMAEDDLNPDTMADASWEPLLPTPPYPSHASNMACIGASAARALARVFDGDEVPFTVTWVGAMADDAMRSYASFSDLADESGRSRVYGGIHFDFELTAAAESCEQVADFVVDNYLLPE